MQPAYDIADDIPRVGGKREVGDTTDGYSHEGKHDGIRDRQPLGERQQQADQPEQGGNGEDGLDGIGHEGRPRRTYRHPHFATRRTAAMTILGD